MIPIEIEYQEDLHCKAVQGPSEVELGTDVPAHPPFTQRTGDFQNASRTAGHP